MFKNYFKNNSKSIKKLSLALKGFIGVIAVSSYVSNDPRLGFWLLVAGAAIEFLLQLLPPDAEAPGKNSLGVWILAALFFTAIPACKIIKPETSYSKKDSTSISYKEQEVKVAGAKVTADVNLDSLVAAKIDQMTSYKRDSAAAVAAGLPIPQAPDPVIKYITDPQSKAILKYWLDAQGKLQMSCESTDQVVKVLVAEITRLTQEVTKKTEVVTETPKWNWIVIGALSALLFGSVLLNLVFFKSR